MKISSKIILNKKKSIILSFGEWLFVSIIYLLFNQIIISSQSLSIVGIDVSKYPTIKAKIYVTDDKGNQIQGLSTSDFSINEDWKSRVITKLDCPAPEPNQALSTVLTFDISNSMSFGAPNINIAKAAGNAWVNALPVGTSECAITSFNRYNYLNIDFTTDKSLLLKTIGQLTPFGATSYDAGFSLPPAGAIPIALNGKYKKIIVFMTDGQPNSPPDENAIIKLALENNISIFCITLGMPMPKSLQNISSQTGGQCFDNVTTKEEAETIYRNILQYSLSHEPCEVEWMADGCNQSRELIISIPKYSVSDEIEFTVSPDHLPLIEQNSSNTLDFGVVLVGQKGTMSRIITARNENISIDKISNNNPEFTIIDYGGSPPPFILLKDESRTLTIEFTPKATAYAFSKFQIVSGACDGNIFYVIGNKKEDVKGRDLITVIHPNGGELLISGSDTTVTWESNFPEDSVILEYSLNDGVTWNWISKVFNKEKYRWKNIPKTESNRCLLRVTNPSLIDTESEWVHQYGSKGDDTGADVCIDKNNNLFLAGTYSGLIDFGNGYKLNSYGNTNGFIAKFNSLALCIKAIDGSSVITLDKKDNLYAGNQKFNNTLDFLKSFPIYNGINDMTITSNDDIFVINATEIRKFSSNGTLQWSKSVQGLDKLGGNPNGFGTGISSDLDGNVYATGTFSGELDLGNNIILRSFQDKLRLDTEDGFLAKFDSYGICLWIKHIGSGSSLYHHHDKGLEDWVNDICIDDENNSYITGAFSYQSIFGDNFSLESYDSTDFFIAKYDKDGLCQWIQQGKGYKYDEGVKICLDKYKNIYTIGRFQRDISFSDSVMLKQNDSNDIFVAKFDNIGTCIWAKSIWSHINKPYNVGLSVDNFNNVYVTGSFADTLYVDSIPKKVSYGKSDCFLIKFNENGVDISSDISDSLWSIIKPEATSKDINFGKQLVNISKDSIFKDYLTNTKNVPIRIDSIFISGSNKNDFWMVSGFLPFTIPPKSVHPVEFSFYPSAVGLRTANITIITQSDTITKKISGTGIQPELVLLNNLIDFGKVTIGDNKDTLMTAIIKNVGTASISITKVLKLSPDTSQFSILNGENSFSLQPDSSYQISLRFTPVNSGRTNGRIGFFYNDEGSPLCVNLFGEGIEKVKPKIPPIIQSTRPVFKQLTCESEALDTITVTNTGEELLIIDSVQITGIDSSDFSLIPQFLQLSIYSGKTENLIISFKPQDEGIKKANLTFFSNAVPDSIFSIPLTARKDSTGIQLSSNEFDFGIMCPDESFVTSITVTNVGTVGTFVNIDSLSGYIYTKNHFWLDSGQAQNIMIRNFGFPAEGDINEQIVFTDSICGYKSIFTIKGSVIMPNISISEPSLTAIKGSYIDGKIYINNFSKRDVNVIKATPLDTQFCVIGNPFPLLIPSNGTDSISISYTPLDTNSANSDLIIEAEPCSIKRTSQIFGIVTYASAEIQIGTIEGSSGEIVGLPIFLGKNQNLTLSDIKVFNGNLKFNHSILEPYNDTPIGEIVGTERVIPIKIENKPGINNLLKTVYLRATLGNDTISKIYIDELSSDNGSVRFTSIPGEFRLKGICREGGPRLINSTGNIDLMLARPNPTSDICEIEYEVIETGRTKLYISSSMGMKLLELIDGYVEKGRRIMTVDVSGLSSGGYFVVFETPTERRVVRLDIVK